MCSEAELLLEAALPSATARGLWSDLKREFNVGALINRIGFWVPCYNYSIMGPKTLF